MQKNNSDHNNLFLSKAIEAKKSNFGTVIDPIGKFPLLSITLIFILLFGLILLISLYKIERNIKIDGVTLFANKPIKLISNFSGKVSDVFVSNGDYVKTNQSLLKVKADNISKNITSIVPGYVERLFIAPGESISKGDTYGLLVPKKVDLAFEMKFPIDLVSKVNIGDILNIKVINNYIHQNESFNARVTFISKLPSENKLNSYYTVVLSPQNNNLDLPIGTKVLYNLVESNKTIIEALK